MGRCNSGDSSSRLKNRETSMFALIDCNNFYASCERLFRPDLRGQPIVVLSNNDGCAIARSEEAKALGIKMGAPYFEIKGVCKQHKVQVFSSNYTLYGDLSRRVMMVIEAEWPEVEIYSIDEAFLDLGSMPASQHEAFCINLQKKILKYTGIPTSIGIGPTKTLAKIANHICKRELKIPVFNVSGQREWLKKITVGDVWGVGRQWQKKLVQQGIYTAHDLAVLNPHVLKKQFNVVLMRTAMELQGIACGGLELPVAKKSIVSSRSFGCMQTEMDSLAQAISSHAARACEKLREEKLLARHLSIFVRTNPFRQDLLQYSNAIQIALINPTDDLRTITTAAKDGLKKIYRAGYDYKKVGLELGELIDRTQYQLDLFNQPTATELAKQEQLMSVFETINRRYGRHTIKLAAEGFDKSWAMRSQQRSPHYTSSWSELAKVPTSV